MGFTLLNPSYRLVLVIVTGRTAQFLAVWCEAALATAALLFFPLLVLLPRGTAALASVAGLCAAGLVLSARRRNLSPSLGLAALLLGCLLFYGAVSALWSITPLRSLVVAARLAGLFAIGLALAAAAGSVSRPRRLTLCLSAGLAFGLALALGELATGGVFGAFFTDQPYRVTRLNQASISFAILLFPTSAALLALGQTIWAGALLAAGAATICALAGTAAKAVLIAGIPAVLILYRARGAVARIAAVLSVILIVTAPLSFARLERLPGVGEAADDVKISAGHRLLIWSFVGDRIAERPLVGWGLDSSRAIPGGEDLIRFDESWLPLHPHNAALQLWLELGAPGVALFALLVAILWRALATARWPRLYAAAAGAGLTVALVASFTTYGVWQEWWLGALSFSLFLVLVMARAASINKPEHPTA